MRSPLLCIALLFFAHACNGDRAKVAPKLTHQPSEVPKAAGEIRATTQYTLKFDDAQHHYLHVRAVYPAPANQVVELSMAVWTPGSYLVREYARHVEDIRAAAGDGAHLAISKTRKNRWSVTTGANPGLVVEYKLYCNELSVRTNFVDSDNAVINGAPTFMRMVEDGQRAATVELVLPEEWQDAVTGLDAANPGVANTFQAKNYDELVDSPLIAGRELLVQTFDIEGVTHHVAHLGDVSQWDTEEALADIEQLARAEALFWNVLPYEHYHFLNVVLGGGGGLEHLDSTLVMAKPFRTRTRSGYRNWLGLVAHEFFHTWNVKRLRPKSLGPFDYENEVHTRSLWVAEGITSYYDDLLLRRAGLLDEKQYLEKLSGQIRALQTTPGRRVQPLAQASYDAWIKYYRSDENSPNTATSYYTKGAVVAFLLDVEIRVASGGKKSLDDLMRLMHERYSGDVGYTPSDFRGAASEVAGVDLEAFFAHAVDSTAELDYGPATSYFGLTLEDREPSEPEEEDSEDDDPAAHLGLQMSGSHVSRVLRETPAYNAGFNAGDEIVAIDGYRLSGSLASLLGQFRPEQKLSITIARRGRLRVIEAIAGKTPKELWGLSVDESRSLLQKRRYEQWIREYANL
ncbi:MAG: M61 family metallopeptidase [Myxococcales bacterium]|nr:M61 family metallopeptidase [Myxococcales bacterium]